MPSAATFLLLAPEIRITIYGFLFQALIADLPDKLFAVFSVFDNTYDTTRDFKTECKPSFLRVRCPHKPISTWLCGHHAAGLLAFNGPPRLSCKVFRHYKLDREAVMLSMNPQFKAWHQKDKEFGARIYAGENPFRSSVTSILLVNRTIYFEAISVLYEHAEIVINLRNGSDFLEKHNNPESEPFYPRFEGVKLTPLSFVRILKLNIWLDGMESSNSPKIIQRLDFLMDALGNCSSVESLEIFIDGGGTDDRRQVSKVVEVLKTRLLLRPKKNLHSALISLGKVSAQDYSPEQFDLFLKAIHGEDMGRFQKALEPNREDVLWIH
ncbi:hypothetical protein N0V82_004859 [Gnomoniopsis sp. IMI 355080]|nr:hypothetical protein N0V82_004859 [Gnomoniopsis sp. IMI 355080]